MDSEEILLMRGASYLLPDPGGEVVRDLLNELDRLLASLDKAERDAERYRWIRDCLWSPIKDEMELQIGPLYFLQSDYQPKDIDWTIDAAMAREVNVELDTINKLYLELSQIATAKTANDLRLERAIDISARRGRLIADIFNHEAVMHFPQDMLKRLRDELNTSAQQ